jgi:hypothetical protein
VRPAFAVGGSSQDHPVGSSGEPDDHQADVATNDPIQGLLVLLGEILQTKAVLASGSLRAVDIVVGVRSALP